jgi:hypothetical protein
VGQAKVDTGRLLYLQPSRVRILPSAKRVIERATRASERPHERSTLA